MYVLNSQPSSMHLRLMNDFFFFSSRRRHTRLQGDWSSDVCSSDLCAAIEASELGASVLILECAPRDFRGGNSRHTRNLRYVHGRADRILTGPYEEERSEERRVGKECRSRWSPDH